MLDSLLDAQRLLIRQVKEWSEILVGYEARNRYEVQDETGRVVARVAEEVAGFGRWLGRQFLGSCRQATLHVLDEFGGEIARIEKPFRWYFQEVVLWADGRPLGTVVRRFGLLVDQFAILTTDGTELLAIERGFWDHFRFRGTFRATRDGVEVARIRKEWRGILAEAFTAPPMMHLLGEIGFSQSYTYFTWRTAKSELEEFGRQIAEHADYARPNLFVNTPDILHESLQHGGPGMFAIRAVLATTMGTSWGVYSGYELFESAPARPGSEEYLDSEKYQLRPRDFAEAVAEGRSLEPFIARLNEIRRLHPALCQLRTIRFHAVDNEALLAYSKFDPNTGDTVLVVVTLNPFGAEQGTVWLDMGALAMSPWDRFWVRDEITGDEYQWGRENFVRLEPARAVAHILNMPPIPPEQRAPLLRRE
jgi:hypothetical protein